jgi:hypothetical protein
MAKLKIPKSLGACADLLYDLREKRLAAQKVVDAFATDETALKEHIIENLPKGDTGASGKHHHISVYTDPVPRIEDPDALYAHIKKTGDFDLLQRRLNNAAVKERWDDPKNKKGVPGVGTFNVVKVSLTKKKGK